MSGMSGGDTYVGTYENAHDSNTKFNGPALTRKIEDNYKFVEYFTLRVHGMNEERCLQTSDEAFLVWLEKYGENKWFKEQGGVKKAVSEIRKQFEKQSK